MKGNRLRACRKVVRRVAVSFATPFLKSKEVKGNRDKNAVMGVGHGDTRHEEDKKVLVTDELCYAGSKLPRWVNASARNDANVTPVDDSTWAYLMEANCPLNHLSGISNGSTSRDAPKHIGSMCKDYSIFEVCDHNANVSPVDDCTLKSLTHKKIHPRNCGKALNCTKQPRCVPRSSFKHLGDLCKDYSIFQVEG
ncbi:hypothetical protein ScPMuIL_003781 [Solemya velum]